MTQKFILPILAFVVFAMPGAALAEAGKAKLYGVLTYADWCGSCKILDPAVEEARSSAKLDDQEILFVTLDLTDDTTKKQSELLAGSLGFGEFYKANNGKTGSFILIDAESGAEVARYKKDSDAAAIAAGVQSKLN